jgi:hypothetical protein
MLNGTMLCGGTTGVACPSTNGSGAAVLSGVSLGTIAAGNYATGIVAQFQGDANYGMSTGTGALTVNQAPQSISFAQPTSPAAYLSTFAVTPTATSGLPTTVTASGGCTATQSGNSYSVTMTSSTTACVLTATQVGNTDYSAATPVTRTVAASKALASITITNTVQTYDGTPRPVTVSTSPNGLAYTVTYAGSATVPTNADSYPVNVAVNDTDYQGTQNATLIVSQAPATVSFTSPLTVTYNGSAQAVTVATSPVGLPTTITYSPGPGAPTNAGTYSVTASVNSPNYSGSTTGTLRVNSATTSVLVDAKTVTSQNGASVLLTGSVYATSGSPVPMVTQGTITFSFSGSSPCSSSPSAVTVSATGAASASCSLKNGVGNGNTFTIVGTYNPSALNNFATNTGSATMTAVSNGGKDTNLSVSPAHASTSGGPVTLQATLTDINNAGVSGKSITFSINGAAVCGGSTGTACPTTSAGGMATLVVNVAAAPSSTYPISATWAGDGAALASNGSARLTVN